jgi:hypothetical protein
VAVGAGVAVAWLVVRVGLGSSHPVAMESEGAGERRPPGVVVRGCKGMAPLAATVVPLRDGAQCTGVSAGGVWWLVANQCQLLLCSSQRLQNLLCSVLFGAVETKPFFFRVHLRSTSDE